MLAVNENAGSLDFIVSRNSPVGIATVHYATADGTAVAGVNYTSTSGTLVFAPGVTTMKVIVPVIDDGIITGPLKFSLALSNPVNVVLGTPVSATVTEINTDTQSAGLLHDRGEHDRRHGRPDRRSALAPRGDRAVQRADPDLLTRASRSGPS